MSLSNYIFRSTGAKKNNDESQEITHIPTLDGEALPQLCNRIWQNECLYIKVANYNNLNKFRNLNGGDQLTFPPIIQPE